MTDRERAASLGELAIRAREAEEAAKFEMKLRHEASARAFAAEAETEALEERVAVLEGLVSAMADGIETIAPFTSSGLDLALADTLVENARRVLAGRGAREVRKWTPEELEFSDHLSWGAWAALRDTDLTTAKAVDEFVQKYSPAALRGLPGIGKLRVIEITDAVEAILRPAK